MGRGHSVSYAKNYSGRQMGPLRERAGPEHAATARGARAVAGAGHTIRERADTPTRRGHDNPRYYAVFPTTGPQALPRPQIGPRLRKKFIHGDTEHLSHSHYVEQAGIGRRAGAGLAPFQLLESEPRQVGIVRHMLLTHTQCQPTTLHIQPKFLGIRRPFIRQRGVWHGCQTRTTLTKLWTYR